ncbi:MAG: nitroreductase family protein [Eubacterium sp.]|nr:nitroreductase family protein [Eubacterium sp.]
MNLYEAIFSRKSVRSFTNEAVSEEILDKIREQFNQILAPFGKVKADYSVLDNRKGQLRMLSMFSVKAPYYLAFYSDQSRKHMMNIGYLMEEMVLFLTTLGLGTCFIGSRRVKKDDQTKGDLSLVGLVAFGHAKGDVYRKSVDASRLPMDEICIFKEVPRQWMQQLLEAARLAPSALNSQPWRFVVYDNRIHIFCKKHKAENMTPREELEFGIMLANLQVASEELWLDVDLIKLENIEQKTFPNNQYVLSAVMKA